MKQNMGYKEQAVRMLLGLAIVSLAFIGPQTVWAWLGVFVTYAGAWGVCPIYTVLGINRCESAEDELHAA